MKLSQYVPQHFKLQLLIDRLETEVSISEIRQTLERLHQVKYMQQYVCSIGDLKTSRPCGKTHHRMHGGLSGVISAENALAVRWFTECY